MRDPRDDIQLKIQRADKHLCDFRASIVEFRRDYPYRFRVERDPNTREPVYRAILNDIPPLVPLIAGDVLQNLRSALDYLACALVVRNSGKVTKDTAFPIFDDAAKYQAGCARKVEGMHQFAKDEISKIEPYQGGDNTLWRLHRLNNIDKHRLLFTAEGAVKMMNPGGGQWVGIPDAPPTLKDGGEIFRDLPDAELNQDMQFFGEIAINEPKIPVCEPLILVLSQSLRRVRQIADKFVIHLL